MQIIVMTAMPITVLDAIFGVIDDLYSQIDVHSKHLNSMYFYFLSILEFRGPASFVSALRFLSFSQS